MEKTQFLSEDAIEAALTVVAHLKAGKCPYWNWNWNAVECRRDARLCELQEGRTGNHRDCIGEEW
jgi:hypothetical protein